MRRALLMLVVLMFLLPVGDGGITVVSTSTPSLTAISPPVRLVAIGGSSCALAANVNATGGSLAIPAAGGLATYNCFTILDDGSPQRAYKMRIVGNPVPPSARLDDVQIKEGGTTLVKWQGGSVATAESGWMNIGGSGATIEARVKLKSVTPDVETVTTVEVLVARSGQTSVYSVYTLTLVFAAG